MCILITEARLKSFPASGWIAGLYTLFEWMRLYLFSGFSFNPIGLALTSSLWGLQLASLMGIYGLTFVVLFTNLLTLRVYLFSRAMPIWIAICSAPYLFGFAHIQWHESSLAKSDKIKTLLVQTAFPTEETLHFTTFEEALAHVVNEWNEIFTLLAKERYRDVDLIVLPEYVVPYGTYVAVYPYNLIKELFTSHFGPESLQFFPARKPPLALDDGSQVTNGFISQALSNLFHADFVVGLQDDQWINQEGSQSYSGAFYFWPGAEMGLRYEKRILVPMGEYIPFEFCKELAQAYGITGSFTCGTQAKIFPGCKAPFGLSICYEETYGHLMRENRLKGAELLINVTSDVWYPNSRLPKQHFDHARLRTVEAGIPLVRSCNTGITCALDSLGQTVDTLGEDAEWKRSALYVEVPLYHYPTLYARFGDWLIILFSAISFLGLLPFRSKP